MVSHVVIRRNLANQAVSLSSLVVLRFLKMIFFFLFLFKLTRMPTQVMSLCEKTVSWKSTNIKSGHLPISSLARGQMVSRFSSFFLLFPFLPVYTFSFKNVTQQASVVHFCFSSCPVGLSCHNLVSLVSRGEETLKVIVSRLIRPRLFSHSFGCLVDAESRFFQSPASVDKRGHEFSRPFYAP